MRTTGFLRGAAFLTADPVVRFALTFFGAADFFTTAFRTTFFTADFRATFFPPARAVDFFAAFFAAFFGAAFLAVDFLSAAFLAVTFLAADFRAVVFFATAVLRFAALVVRAAFAAFLRAAGFVALARRACLRGVAIGVACFTVRHQHGADPVHRKIRRHFTLPRARSSTVNGRTRPVERSTRRMHHAHHGLLVEANEIEAGGHAREADADPI
ncbi:MAG TPA: hypothetical protein PLL57_11795, partial [Flavobacteriales bacterium]|nr:hypothetical protein [Flavobacteriales bacterium]